MMHNQYFYHDLIDLPCQTAYRTSEDRLLFLLPEYLHIEDFYLFPCVVTYCGTGFDNLIIFVCLE